ncbi:YadA-like family protein [Novosphingobium sp.]|uniref:YadA-like family protein n=1 Tax=Novosphingobium sp. TaxID=1874826 RepID=UPI00261CCD23|nr:YadA-like family protein [Novosphingobium sp.]
MINKNLGFYVSMTAIAAALAATPQAASAQVASPPQIPIAETQCSGGTFFHPLSMCTVSGTRTNTDPVVTATPSTTRPGFFTVTHTENVTFDGTMVIGGAALPTSPGSTFTLPPQFLYGTDVVSVEGSLAYTGSVSSQSSNGNPQPGAPLGQFQRYTIQDLDVRAINVDFQGEADGLGPKGREDFNLNLKSVDPTAVVNNSTVLAGSYRGTSDTGGLIFGKLGGSATVISAAPNMAVVTPAANFLDDQGRPAMVFLSPLGVEFDVTSQETTVLDEKGLVTPTISVTDGINMNGSRITNLGMAMEDGDAVNLAQVNELIATNGTVQNAQGQGALVGGNNSSANGVGAVALGDGQQANGNGAVAIGDPNIATGIGAVAIGAENTATGRGAIAMGEQNTATGQGAVALGILNTAGAQGAVAIGAYSTASQIGNVAIGFDAEATGSGSAALGGNSLASATGTTALGNGATATSLGATATGYRANASGVDSTVVGTSAAASATASSAFGRNASATAVGSVALGANSVADQANTVSVGSAGAERRIVNVASAVAATDAVNKAQFDAESTQRQAAEAMLQSNIAAEAGLRVAGDAALQSAVDAEVMARSAGDLALQNAVDAEAATRAAAVMTLQGAINSEASTRAAADMTLQGAINSEASTRAAADTNLQNAVNAEATTRAAAVASLQSGLSAEAATRLAADNAEANARAAADNQLQTQINTLGTSLFSLTGRVTTLENTVRQDRQDARRGIAAAVAMTQAPMPSAPGKVSYSVNVANFRDEQAVSASMAMRLRGPSTMAVTAGVAYGGGSNTAVRVGVAGEF